MTDTTITLEHIENIVVREIFFSVPESTMTICVLELENGFNVTGESAWVDPANYDAEVGRDIARRNAVEKVWQLEGYLLQERLFREECLAEAQEHLAEALARTFA